MAIESSDTTTTTAVVENNNNSNNNNNNNNNNSNNVNSSEYQSSYSWKLPMVNVPPRPKERTVTEYQREFSWPESPSITPAPTSNINVTSTTTTPVNNSSLELSRATPEIKNLDLSTPNTPTLQPISSSIDVVDLTTTKNLLSENDNYNNNYNNNNNKWKDGLRKENIPIETKQQQQQQLSSLQVSATNFLDPRTKKIIALEANRLSKKSRSYSMYTLADQLKTAEASRDLSIPFESEYKQQFVNWDEFGFNIREDIPENKYSNDNSNSINPILRRRGSWSSSSPLPTATVTATTTTTTTTTTSSKQQAKNSLPYQLKWLEDLATRESMKLQPTITDANSIRANPVRPKTSADFRNYQIENENENIEDIFSTSPPLLLKASRKIEKIDKFDKLDKLEKFDKIKNDLDYYYPTNSNGGNKSSLVRTKSSADLQRSKSSCGSPLRNSILLKNNNLDSKDDDNHYDNYDDVNYNNNYNNNNKKNNNNSDTHNLLRTHELKDSKISKPPLTAPLSSLPTTTAPLKVSPPPSPLSLQQQPPPSQVIDVRRRNHERESLNRDTYIDERRRDYENLYSSNNNNPYDERNKDSMYDEKRRDVGYDERKKDIGYDERKKDIGYDERKKDIGYDERRKDIRYDERKKDIGYDERNKDIGYDERKKDIGYDERRRDNVHEERRRDNVHEERKRDNIYEERRRDSVYDERRRDNVHDERKRDSIHDERRRDSVYDNHHKDYDGYNKIRQQDNGFDGRHNIQPPNNSRLDNHDDYESRYNNNNNNNKISEQREQYIRGHTRNSSYASSSISSVLNDDGQPLSANHSYLKLIRHKSSFSDTSSISSPSSPATPNGLYDNIEQRWKPNNGLDPRIYKEQTYASSIISKTSSKSSWQVDDINKDRYHHQSSGLKSSPHSKFYIDDDEIEDDNDSPHHSISKRQSQSHLASLMLKDRPLTSMGIRSPSTPRSYSSMQSSPSYTRDSSPTRDSLYPSSSRRHHNHQRVASPVYSSRPVSRASVSSSATSIEEESAILTDMLRDADGLTMKNLTSQMSLFKARDFKSVAPGIDTTAKPKPKTSRSTPTPSLKRTSTLSVSTTGSRALSTPTPSRRPANKTTAVTANGTKTSSRTPPSNTKTGSKTTPVAKGVKGTTGAGQPKSKKLPNGSSNKSTSSQNSGNNINISSYRAAYRPPPTDFSEARAALNRAKLKVEEMLEIVSNGGSPF
ncbi:hypothetical protein Glove_326g178 [Diversispora epigaea]|uniref:Uncharacterized protein n=1 Tax=Diversispora epigaea TaxID=1348612 RepID=A0A397HM46_9GLOM|nr:hypothetical protein Glove_326g178 [Diversispora epigaea]